MDVVSISNFTSAVTELAETGFSMANDVMQTVVGNPVLLAFLALPLVGLGIGLVKRLLHISR